jgi:hypothetical protein
MSSTSREQEIQSVWSFRSKGYLDSRDWRMLHKNLFLEFGEPGASAHLCKSLNYTLSVPIQLKRGGYRNYRAKPSHLRPAFPANQTSERDHVFVSWGGEFASGQLEIV